MSAPEPFAWDRTVVTRHGATVSVRRCRESDAADLYAMEVALVRDGRGQVRSFADLPTAERFADRMLGKLEDTDVWLVAEHDGRVVGSGTVSRLRVGFCQHVATLGIGIHPDAQGLGIGRALMVGLVEGAEQIGVVRLELYVRSDNARAIPLYRSLGFEPEALRRDFVRLPDGTFVDDWSMVRWCGRHRPTDRAGTPS